MKKLTIIFLLSARPPRRFVPRSKSPPRGLLSLRRFMALSFHPYLMKDCTAPVAREIFARDVAYSGKWVSTSGCVDLPDGTFRIERWQEWRVKRLPFCDGRILRSEIFVRCRKCDNCAAHRQRVWQARALFEFGQAERTWFLTLTLGFYGRLSADTSGNANSWIKKELQLFLKRLRQDTGLPIRYLCAVEAHKDGTPHLHLLLHDEKGLLPKRAIQRHWRYGFSNCKLAEKDKVFYVCKYITKTLIGGRIPCSLRYGDSKRIENSLT